MDLKENMKLCCKAVIELNEEMHQILVAFVKAHNGLIRTDNYQNKPILYAIANTLTQENEEYPILAVAVKDEQLAVLLDYTNGYENLEGISDQKVLESVEWEKVMGGDIVQNVTLYNLCENLDSYV